jgi:hypothetical protein
LTHFNEKPTRFIFDYSIIDGGDEYMVKNCWRTGSYADFKSKGSVFHRTVREVGGRADDAAARLTHFLTHASVSPLPDNHHIHLPLQSASCQQCTISCVIVETDYRNSVRSRHPLERRSHLDLANLAGIAAIEGQPFGGRDFTDHKLQSI